MLITENQTSAKVEARKTDGDVSTKTFGEAELLAVTRRLRGELTRIDVDDFVDRVGSRMADDLTEGQVIDIAIQTAAAQSFREPQFSKLAARYLSRSIAQELASQEINGFIASLKVGVEQELLSPDALAFAEKNKVELLGMLRPERDRLFEFFGLRTLADRYLLRHPHSRKLIETPQFFFLRVCLGICDTMVDIRDLYNRMSTFEYMPSSPTLFNSATNYQQLSSCFLLDSPKDDLASIYDKYRDIAMLSKFAGGIGLSYSRVRSEGSLIKGTNGLSRGVIPFLNTLDASVAAVNQGGRRKGAACVYLETWHADIESFLELRENTGDESRRTYNLNIANWVPDLFMQRVESDEMWSLFDPKEFPELVDTYGEQFEAIYTEAERSGSFVKQVKARELYGRMMKSLAQTGNGWMCFKDSSNKKSNQTASPENVIHLSNLCTEILEVTSDEETAVCNLGSVNLSKHVTEQDGKRIFDFTKLAETVRIAVRQLDRVIDRNLYPIDTAASSNGKWRPVGLGIMGLQDVFFMLRHPFDSPEALELSNRISEEVYYHALKTSNELAKTRGAHPLFKKTRAASGQLEFDRWGVTPSDEDRWDKLRKQIVNYGLRNSLMIAIAPTATIASITGCYECTEPQVSNLFKRETLSGEFLQINRYLVADLQEQGLWTTEIQDELKMSEGSIQKIGQLPEELRHLYRTAWELPMKPLIDLAAGRGSFIDQSQSLNLFMEDPNIGRLSSMYFYAWQKGLKTTYYLRSRPATRIAQTTTAGNNKTFTESQAVACSLENPEYCEACQ